MVNAVQEKKGLVNRFLDFIEKAGNKLPEPTILFIILAALVLVASTVLSFIGVSVTNPTTGETIHVNNLLNREGIIRILTEMISNFTTFAPLGIVLVTTLGIGLAESTGLVNALLKRTILNAPSKLIIPILIFVSVVAGLASDAATILVPPIAAIIFISIGKHPMVGLLVSYASILGGLSANVIVNGLDVLLYGITQQTALLVDPSYTGNALMNYYFLAVSTFLLVIVGTFVTHKFVEPRFTKYEGEVEVLEGITAREKKALNASIIAILLYIVIVLLLVVPKWGWLRNIETNEVLISPFMSSIGPLMMLMFLIPGLVFGIVNKTIKSDRDFAKSLYGSISSMAPFIVLAFFAAQMIAYFNWSNLGIIIAIKGASFLSNLNITGVFLFVGFILLCALINLFIGSASAKWGLLAPVFIPMFMYLGYDPALTQLAYRIGDSITNPITPLLANFAILLALAQKYNKNFKMGTLISGLLPYSIGFGIGWIILFVIWYLLGLPIGPGAGLYYELP